jgi:uncharacterized membrane protein YqiK
MIIILFIFMFYIKVPTKDTAFVKTGGFFGKSSVSIDNICFGLRGFHAVTPINLKVFKISVVNHGHNAFMAKDAFVDIDVAFTIKVGNGKDFILKANESYGKTTFDLNRNENIISQLTGAIRNTVASHTISELQSDRKIISKDIEDSVNALLNQNGLVLQNVSIETLKQTDPSTLVANDVFTAKTRAMTAGEIELRKKEENDAIKSNELSIMRKNVEVDKAKYELEKERANALIEVEKQKIEFESQRLIKIAKSQALQEEESSKAIIDKDIAIQLKQTEMLKVQEATFKAQELSNLAEISSITARQKAEAERDKEIGIILAQKEMEQEKLKITVPAEAQLEKIKKDTEAKMIQAKNEVEIIKIQSDTEKYKKQTQSEAELNKIENESRGIALLAEANKVKYQVEADGKALMNEAENKISAEVIAFKLKEITLSQLVGLTQAMYKPFEKVGSFNVIQAQGLIGGNSGNGESSAEGGNLPNQILGALQKNKIVNPLIDKMLSDAGLSDNIISDITKQL